jgi:hypothetical protein
MEKLDQKIDTMRQEFESQGQKQAQDRWQARVDELQRERSEAPHAMPILQMGEGPLLRNDRNSITLPGAKLGQGARQVFYSE